MNTVKHLCACVMVLSLFAQCGGGGGGKSYPRFLADDNQIIEFTFTASRNSSLGLKADYTGVITDSSIALQVPNDAVVTSLVASYVTNSTDVQVKGVSQTSGTTVNDFTAPVVYRVIAENGDEREYTVTVTKAPGTEKRITSYSLIGASGTIDEAAGTIAVELPPRSSVKDIAATFSAVGKSITVGGMDQESGVTKHDFSTPVEYTVSAEDGTTKTYRITATVMLSPWNDINVFSFPKADNTALKSDVAGIISGTDISVELPFGSDRATLVAYFETEGKTVAVGSVEQVSGDTKNDFSNPVTYRVTAENGDVKEYKVAVTVAKSDARAMTQFYLDGEKGAIDENAGTISVSFPTTKNLSVLKAAFVTTGVSVKVGDVEQVSGITANDFSSPVPYVVTADSGAKQTYEVTAVKSSDMTGLWNFESAPDGYKVVGATDVPSVTGNALQFNGTTDYVLVKDSDSLTLAEAGSIEAVVKVISHRPYAGIVHKGVLTDFSDETYSLQFWGAGGTDGTLRFSIFNDKNEYLYVDSSQKLATDMWYHLVATWDATQVRIYINGKLETSKINTIGKVRDSGGDLVIGAQLDRSYSSSWGNVGFNGIIDRVVVYNRSLAENEVSANYQDLVASGGGAFTAFLLSAASRNLHVIIIALVLISLMLGMIYVYNRRRVKDAG